MRLGEDGAADLLVAGPVGGPQDEGCHGAHHTCEESRNPTRIIPRATLVVVVALGVLCAFVSRMTIAGNGTADTDLRDGRSTGFRC